MRATTLETGQFDEIRVRGQPRMRSCKRVGSNRAIALAKSPDDRFQSGDALAEGLHAALTSGLDPKLAKRADALIKKLPWD